MANTRQMSIFEEQPKQAMIAIREGHELIRLSDQLPWPELIDLAVSFRCSKVKRFTGPKPHYRELLGAVALMGVRQVTYRQAEDLIAHYAPARYLCSLMDTTWQPDHITIFEFTQMLGPEGMSALNTKILNHAGEMGLLDPARLMSDTTAQESMTPYPTEVGLMKRFSDLVGKNLRGTRGILGSIRSKAKKLGEKIAGLARNSHLFAKGKEAKQKVGKKLYHTAQDLQHLLKGALTGAKDLKSAASQELKRLSELMDKLFPQILHFLQTGFVAAGKIIHLQMPEISSIVRGKAGKSVEFGLKWGINLIDGFAHGFVIQAGKNVSDQKFCIQGIQEHIQIFGQAPEVYGFDRGGHSGANIKRAQNLGVKHVGIAPRGQASWSVSKTMAERVRRERARVEGLIGNLKSKKYGFNKPNAKSQQTMQTSGQRSILGFNMVKLLRQMALVGIS